MQAADQRDAIAVLEIAVEGRAVPASDAATLTDQLREQVSRTLGARLNVRTRATASLAPAAVIDRCREGKCLADLGRALKATYLVRGTLRKFGTKLSLTIEANEAATGKLLGERVFKEKDVDALSDSLDKELGRLFAMWLGNVPTASPQPETAVTAAPEAERPAPPEKPAPLGKKGGDRADTGTLTVTARPKPGARLELTDPDGKKIAAGASYENRAARSGLWKVIARANGYEEEEQDVEVPPRDAAVVTFKLKAPGSLRVLGTPRGAAISLSGAHGLQEDGELPWRWDGLTSGSYQLKVSLDGYSNHEETVEVKPGETTVVRLQLAPREAPAATTSMPNVPPGMVLIPGGTFRMGSNEGKEDERPVTRVTLAPYLMDRTEVSAEAYENCVAAKKCLATDRGGECNGGRNDRGAHPINCVDWDQAKTFCEAQGGRLPTEAEWEFAARGPEDRRYPWGDAEPDDSRAKFGKWGGGTAPVDSFAGGAGPFGLLNMAGNVWEWVEDAYAPYPGGRATNPKVKAGSSRVARGGGAYSDPTLLRGALRRSLEASFRNNLVGFRCARDVAP